VLWRTAVDCILPFFWVKNVKLNIEIPSDLKKKKNILSLFLLWKKRNHFFQIHCFVNHNFISREKLKFSSHLDLFFSGRVGKSYYLEKCQPGAKLLLFNEPPQLTIHLSTIAINRNKKKLKKFWKQRTSLHLRSSWRLVKQSFVIKSLVFLAI